MWPTIIHFNVKLKIYIKITVYTGLDDIFPHSQRRRGDRGECCLIFLFSFFHYFPSVHHLSGIIIILECLSKSTMWVQKTNFLKIGGPKSKNKNMLPLGYPKVTSFEIVSHLNIIWKLWKLILTLCVNPRKMVEYSRFRESLTSKKNWSKTNFPWV